ncbi:hypothetical protein GCM10010358_68200 [Streptomyces minutiscleroticus]|uniref:Uncharacterized protein n=1 Tax=Streptomyces minutiscleroticus TaxID=68238 RepID=A0A918NYI8_9ACTN|nr:hypothetical protein [Streptomyces minutiscleroticus]GGY05168.1 hypothetical protein GCM10010358_68200 [Streptomyces minutiscleroticus]
MPTPILCHVCHEGRYRPRGPQTYACWSCRSTATAAAFPVQGDERLIVHEGIVQVLTVPEGHQVITPTRRVHAPHLGAGLALALRLHPHRPVFARPEDATTAAELLTLLDEDERGPWVLSRAQLQVLVRAMELRHALLPFSARQYPEFDAEIRAAYAHTQCADEV